MIERNRIAESLEEIALLTELDGGSRAEAAPFHAAARAIQRRQSAQRTAARGRPGKDTSIAARAAIEVAEIETAGASPLLERLRARIPRGVRELLELPTLSPLLVRKIWKEMRILSIEDLEEACIEGYLASRADFSRPSKAELLRAIEAHRDRLGLFLLPEAWEAANQTIASFGSGRIEIAGELRRQIERLREVLFVAEGLPGEENLKGPRGVPVRILRRPPETFEACWLWESSGEAHRVSLAERARMRGFEFDSAGFRKDGRLLPLEEAAIYRSLGLEPFHPCLRERPAEEGPHPSPLIGPESIRGIFHVHTTDSDGNATIAEMVAEAVRLGYEWIGISDHSRTPTYANGLSVERLHAQAEAIERLRPRFPRIRIFHGTESDILPDGSLDYDDSVLAGLDFVVASIHSSMDMPLEKMTGRIERALRHPATTHWGHPSARLFGVREAIECDFGRLLEVCAEGGVSVEFNAHPNRLDLEWRRIPKAVGLGVPVSINADAHSREGLAEPRLRCGTAAKGGLTPAEILNSRSAEEIKEWLERKKRGGGGE